MLRRKRDEFDHIIAHVRREMFTRALKLLHLYDKPTIPAPDRERIVQTAPTATTQTGVYRDERGNVLACMVCGSTWTVDGKTCAAHR